MPVRGWQPKEISTPRGAWTSTALVRKGNPTRGGVSRNVRFQAGIGRKRDGTTVAFGTTAGKVTGMYNWLAPTTTAQNLVVYQDGTTLKRRRLSDSTTLTLLTGVTSRAPSFADLGPNLYMCGWDTNADGTMQCRIHDGLITTGTPDMDVAFRGPLAVTSMTATDTGAGQCTKGTHYVAFIFQSRSGFSGQPSPVAASVFTPASVTLNAGLRTITLAITLDTPSDAGTGSQVYPIMTRADNPNKWFFVPPTFYSPEPTIFPPSTPAWSQSITISITDEDLANSGDPVDDYFNLLVAGVSSGPFSPNFVAPYGKRMTYGAGTQVYVSEIDNPQYITEDQHTISLPSKRKAAVGFQLGDSYYLSGDKWTGRTRDNGDIPSSWEQPSLISDSIGAPYADCTAPHGDGLTKRWIAAEPGLYLFDGAFPALPVTYYWGDYWARINWNASYAIKIADNSTEQRCYVALPLDSATEPSHLLVVDYTNGETFETCDISIDDYATAFSSIARVKEVATNRTNVWLGPQAAGNVMRFDSTTSDDNGAAVHSTWESGYVRGANEIQAKTVRVGNMDFWLRGTGTAPTITWYGLDRATSVSPAIQTNGDVIVTVLASAPGIEYFCKSDLSPVENFTVRVDSNAVGAYWELSGFRAFMRPALWNR